MWVNISSVLPASDTCTAMDLVGYNPIVILERLCLGECLPEEMCLSSHTQLTWSSGQKVKIMV